MVSPSISLEKQWPNLPPGAPSKSRAALMTLRIEKGPLAPAENEAILAHYNRLTSSRIPMNEFLHWVQKSPEGPAWHAILESEDSQLVGHCALIPFRTFYQGAHIVAGKAEYAFILEQYQSAKIRGFESLSKPRNAIMTRQLFEHCRANGFNLMLISTNPAGQRSLWSVGASTLEIPVWECLLVLHPWRAAKNTPNLKPWQRGVLFSVGALQRAGWFLPGLNRKGLHEVEVHPAETASSIADPGRLCFFEDSPSHSWRFGNQEYGKLIARSGSGHLIFKKGARDRYLRVCQWQFNSKPPWFALISSLIDMAKGQNALGVRWAVYGRQPDSMELTRQMRRYGFLCAQRTRKLLVSSDQPDLLKAEQWKLNDAMFSFDP